MCIHYYIILVVIGPWSMCRLWVFILFIVLHYLLRNYLLLMTLRWYSVKDSVKTRRSQGKNPLNVFGYLVLLLKLYTLFYKWDFRKVRNSNLNVLTFFFRILSGISCSIVQFKIKFVIRYSKKFLSERV